MGFADVARGVAAGGCFSGWCVVGAGDGVGEEDGWGDGQPGFGMTALMHLAESPRGRAVRQRRPGARCSKMINAFKTVRSAPPAKKQRTDRPGGAVTCIFILFSGAQYLN